MSKAEINLLDTVPVCKPHIRTEWEGEYAVLAYPRFKRAWMQRLFLPKGMSPLLKVTLEEHGTAVWKAIDGKRTVREIIALLAGHFQGEEDNYPSRVATYLVSLQRDGFISLMMPGGRKAGQ